MSTVILKAEHAYFLPGDHTFSPAELVVVLYWRDPETGMPKFTGSNMPQGLTKKKIQTSAYISHGRWVADCPGPNCFSAQVISPEDRRFWCPTCENAYVQGKWITVDWPRDWKRREEVLLERPEMANRIAFPYETVKDLQRENKEKLYS